LLALARQARQERPDIVVSAGGDGTHHYVVNGLLNSNLQLGLIPLGSCNDISRALGVPSDARAAARILLTGRVREIDLVRAGTRTYLSVAGVGFDSVVNRFANEHVRWIGGRTAYLWALVRCLKFLVPQPLQIVADGQEQSMNVLFAVFGNTTSYADGIHITPRARFDDGLLDACIVPALGKLEFLRWIPAACRGEHLAHRRIIYFQARRVSLRSPGPLELFGDGEFLQKLPATLEVLPQALRVIVPADEAKPSAVEKT